MKVINLTSKSKIYTSNAYCLLGNWNALADVNTLVDVGRDPEAIQKLEQLNTGVGKRRVDQVILTHSHYDHTSILSDLVERYNPRVYAYSSSVSNTRACLRDEQRLPCADQECEIIHIPGHSQDSVCVYCPLEKALFSGDTPLFTLQFAGDHEMGFVNALYKLMQKDVQTIYPGHGLPVTNKCNQIIRETYLRVKKK